MWDHFSGARVDVREDGECGSYIMIEPAEIARVKELLQSNGIAFTVDDAADSCVGTPEAAVIEFGHGADVAKIQRVLDSVQ